MDTVAQSRALPSRPGTSSARSSLITVRLLLGLERLVDSHEWFTFAIVSLVCAWGHFHTLVTRHLNHDELFTYYIAQAPNLRRLLELTKTVDLHPPLSYLLVRASFRIFGISSWSCRLPFFLAFLGASALVFWLLRHLLSTAYGVAGVLLLWSVPFSEKAAEARPYSLVLCFSSLVLVTWYRATEAEEDARERNWVLAGLAVSGFCLLLSHVLAVLPYMVFFSAEAVRSRLRRKLDWKLWVALILPLIAVLTYLPLVRSRSAMLFAQELGVTPFRLVSFYWESIRYIATPLVLIAVTALLYPRMRRRAEPDFSTSPTKVPLAVALGLLSLVPIAIGVLFARTGTAFFDRYGIVWLIPLVLAPLLILGFRTDRNRLVGAVTAVVLATFLFLNTSGKSWLIGELANIAPASVAGKLVYLFALPPIMTPVTPPIPNYLSTAIGVAPMFPHLETAEPDLPLVAHTGLTFMELDHQESAEVTRRLYMLVDEQAASSIAHDTVFAHYERLADAFPLRGKVAPYCSFVKEHPKFLVVGAYNNPQGWLLRKLDYDGAQIRVIGVCSANTEDCQIYEVNMGKAQCQSP